MHKKPTHGGARKGAGRKLGFRMEEKKEPTKVMRVPESLVPKIHELIKKYLNKSHIKKT